MGRLWPGKGLDVPSETLNGTEFISAVLRIEETQRGMTVILELWDAEGGGVQEELKVPVMHDVEAEAQDFRDDVERDLGRGRLPPEFRRLF